MYGGWTHDAGIEDVVAVRISANEFEICTHGGDVAAESICKSLANVGFRRVDWQHVGSGSPNKFWKASAESALVDAKTLKVANYLLANLQELPEAIGQIVANIRQGNSRSAIEQLERLIQTFPLGQRLRDGWTIVIAGRSNVGKSTLMNRLAGFERAIVFDQPGSTLDVVTETIAIDGWPVVLADTAGLRESAGGLEHLGIERASKAAHSADLVVIVSDLSCPWTAEDQAHWEAHRRKVLVHNKRDLSSTADVRPNGILMSLTQDESIEPILNAIGSALFADPSAVRPSGPLDQSTTRKIPGLNLPNELTAVLTDFEQRTRCELAIERLLAGFSEEAIESIMSPSNDARTPSNETE